jgi:hypothetical protein
MVGLQHATLPTQLAIVVAQSIDLWFNLRIDAWRPGFEVEGPLFVGLR